MPIYTFKCKNCGNETDKLCEYEEFDMEIDCKCGGKMVRIPTIPSIVFGKGFFADDYSCNNGSCQMKDEDTE